MGRKWTSYDRELCQLVGRNMRVIRKKRGIKVRHIANHIGCDVSVVYAWERGVNESSYRILKTMSEIYACSIDDFFKENLDEILKPNRSKLDKAEHDPWKRPVKRWNRTMAQEPESVHAPFEEDGVYHSARRDAARAGSSREGSGGSEAGRTTSAA